MEDTADAHVLSAEFILFFLRLLYIVLMMAVGSNPDVSLATPQEIKTRCFAVSAIFLGVGASKYFHLRKRFAGADKEDEEEKILAYVRGLGGLPVGTRRIV